MPKYFLNFKIGVIETHKISRTGNLKHIRLTVMYSTQT